MRRLYVNTYELDQEYGGPEEGGWWVTTYKPISSKLVKGEKMAAQWMANIQAKFVKPENPYWSVVYTGGHYTAMVEEHPAKKQPEVFPRYE